MKRNNIHPVAMLTNVSPLAKEIADQILDHMSSKDLLSLIADRINTSDHNSSVDTFNELNEYFHGAFNKRLFKSFVKPELEIPPNRISPNTFYILMCNLDGTKKLSHWYRIRPGDTPMKFHGPNGYNLIKFLPKDNMFKISKNINPTNPVWDDFTEYKLYEEPSWFIDCYKRIK
jgi:hypothetical protein